MKISPLIFWISKGMPMRMKDAVTVALVLGRELRHASAEEVAGLEAGIGAIRGHMLEVHPLEFDPLIFDAAVEQGREGQT